MKNYDNFSQTFAKSRRNMSWPEIEYFLEFLKQNIKLIDFSTSLKGQKDENLKILDIGCGGGRLLNFLKKYLSNFNYLGIDSSFGMIEEAYKEFPDFKFLTLDMTELDKIETKYDIVFLIASFHHLDSEELRIDVLNKIQKILNDGGLVFMTNWNLMGEFNFAKYEKSYNGNGDFQIKIGAYTRYYHGFQTLELEDLFKKTNFKILENRVFDNGYNVISILEKK